MPEVWFGEGGNANRSTASEQTDVAYKALGEIQQGFRRIFRTMLWFGYDSIQVRQSRLPFRPDAPWLRIEPELPTVQERDISRAAGALVQLEASLESAVASEFISRQSARETFLGMIGKVSGQEFELDKELARIDGEAKEREEEQERQANARARAALGAGEDPDADLEDGRAAAA
jgi:hypothetical protein